jgi:hypothetical protein
MCLGITDTEMLEGITRTGFSDDASIPMWAKPYVSTGLMAGVITVTGTRKDGSFSRRRNPSPTRRPPSSQ